MKTEKNKAFTLVELLVVLAIVAMLIGLLMPALGQVRKYAGTVKQKAQIGSIEIALSLYKNDFGQYPRSHGYDTFKNDTDPNFYDYIYCGAQTLAEAMVGYDLLGVHSDTVFNANGRDISNAANSLLYPVPSATEPNSLNLGKRKGPYLDRTNIGVFTPRNVFDRDTTSDNVWPDKYMICDTFTAVNRKIGSKYCKIGTPILYFRADTSAENTQLIPSATMGGRVKNIYNYYDNHNFLSLGRITDGKPHNLITAANDGSKFFSFITDSMIWNSTSPPLKRPVKPDSFILISAGPDGIYGTKDDICNFDPNSIQ
ncbi:MAG: type II secretion system protein [Sedimentisphaerales bacterium]|jgi:prepilin-type N-terminal cleavage/methylation domain-containing protein